jgi:hypothetical protein
MNLLLMEKSQATGKEINRCLIKKRKKKNCLGTLPNR